MMDYPECNATGLSFTGFNVFASRTHPKMKPLNQPSIAFIDYISYRQLIDRRLIVDIPYVYVYVYVTLDHKNSHKGTFYEIEIYSTS